MEFGNGKLSVDLSAEALVREGEETAERGLGSGGSRCIVLCERKDINLIKNNRGWGMMQCKQYVSFYKIV